MAPSVLGIKNACIVSHPGVFQATLTIDREMKIGEIIRMESRIDGDPIVKFYQVEQLRGAIGAKSMIVWVYLLQQRFAFEQLAVDYIINQQWSEVGEHFIGWIPS